LDVPEAAQEERWPHGRPTLWTRVPRKAKPAAVGVKAAPPAATACPRCGKPIAVRGERGACPSCGLPVRFVDAPERPCAACGSAVAFPPGQEAVRCAACGAWQAADPARPVEAHATCPRCGRDVVVPVEQGRAPCPRCGAGLELGPPVRDTL
jgi:LSD1 subclass zinc finger protein